MDIRIEFFVLLIIHLIHMNLFQVDGITRNYFLFFSFLAHFFPALTKVVSPYYFALTITFNSKQFHFFSLQIWDVRAPHAVRLVLKF